MKGHPVPELLKGFQIGFEKGTVNNPLVFNADGPELRQGPDRRNR